ncbi:hypothetical protein Pcinc_016689 [Petrolisthes cinctipes]|uniref:Carboxylesterase type B domain-containing protein n=1 Tax=Petrolisthes cinctipes TaxID=88211 RepID=A0AAE1KNJ4_PETCI|nr:hypothetical protein Pcinc_016689 [Petrolisthes cinctipes]
MLGVPYALPPLGKLRFRPAQLHTHLDDCWDGTYTANKVQPCWGYDSRGGVVNGWEDCLLVDIFTPQLGYDDPLPVIVYVGGEGLGEDGGRAFTVGAAGRVARDPGRGGGVTPGPSGPTGIPPTPTAGCLHLPPHIRAHKLVRAAWLSGAAPRHPNTPWRQADPSLVSQLNCSSVLCLQSVPPEDVMEAVSPERRHDTSEPWMVADGVIVPFIPAPPPITLMIGSPLQGLAHRLLSWRDRVGSSRRNLVDAVVEALQTHKVKDEEEENTREFGRVRWPPLQAGNNRRKILFDSRQAERAIEWYSDLQEDPWRLLTTLVSDATVTCPALEKAATLARTRSHSRHNTEDVPVYSYVTRYDRTSRAGRMADGLSDIEAILGVFEEHNESDAKFSKTLQDLFFLFVRTGMPERHGPTSAHLGVYTMDETMTVMRSRLACAHWVNMSHLATRY